MAKRGNEGMAAIIFSIGTFKNLAMAIAIVADILLAASSNGSERNSSVSMFITSPSLRNGKSPGLIPGPKNIFFALENNFDFSIHRWEKSLKFCRCAVPIFVNTAISGDTIFSNTSISPGRDIPTSIMAISQSSFNSSKESATPS